MRPLLINMSHSLQSNKPCRYGGACKNIHCKFFHGIKVKQLKAICSKGLLCVGKCKFYHEGRINKPCHNSEFCSKIGVCRYLHPTPSPCLEGYECDNKECQRIHETVEQYHLRLALPSNIKWEKEFTREGLVRVIQNGAGKCHCPRCPRKEEGSGNPCCSSQCGGFTESHPQKVNPWGSADLGGQCRHEHSKCLILDCMRPCVTKILVPEGWYMGFFAMPFCKHHAPKCHCGLPRFTCKRYDFDEAPTPEKIQQMMQSYNDTCFKHTK